MLCHVHLQFRHLTHWGRDKMAAFSQTTLWNAFFFNENTRISIKVSLKFVPKGPINNIPALVQIMDWRWSGGKPLSEPMMISLLTHICVTRPQWVKALFCNVFCVRKTNNPVTHVLYVTRLVLQQKTVIRSQGEHLYKLISHNNVSEPSWRHDI